MQVALPLSPDVGSSCGTTLNTVTAGAHLTADRLENGS